MGVDPGESRTVGTVETVIGAGTSTGQRRKRGGPSAALLIAGAVLGLGVPSAVLAVSGSLESRPVSLAARGGIGSFTPASVDPRLARAINLGVLSRSPLFRFTPAGTNLRPDRSVTIAVRVDQDTARVISLRPTIASLTPGAAQIALRIAPTAYSLGVSRGYQGFAPSVTPPVEGKRPKLVQIDMPDLKSFRPADEAKGAPSRFGARIALDEREKVGRSPRTLEALGEQTLDVAGSYRLGRNLNVTAGVRYSQDRDRVVPLTDGKQDSQAVYVGTQFRF